MLDRFRQGEHTLDRIEAAFEVERFLRGPETLQQGKPLRCVGVPRLMIFDDSAKRLKGGWIRARYDIESEPPAGYVIRRGCGL